MELGGMNEFVRVIAYYLTMKSLQAAGGLLDEVVVAVLVVAMTAAK